MYAIGDRRIDSQAPSGSGTELIGRLIGVFDIGQDLTTTLVIKAPNLRQTLPACSAIQQATAEPVFQRPNVETHHGGGDAQCRGRRGKSP